MLPRRIPGNGSSPTLNAEQHHVSSGPLAIDSMIPSPVVFHDNISVDSSDPESPASVGYSSESDQEKSVSKFPSTLPSTLPVQRWAPRCCLPGEKVPAFNVYSCPARGSHHQWLEQCLPTKECQLYYYGNSDMARLCDQYLRPEKTSALPTTSIRVFFGQVPVGFGLKGLDAKTMVAKYGECANVKLYDVTVVPRRKNQAPFVEATVLNMEQFHRLKALSGRKIIGERNGSFWVASSQRAEQLLAAYTNHYKKGGALSAEQAAAQQFDPTYTTPSCRTAMVVDFKTKKESANPST